jgi:hypothetical protein
MTENAILSLIHVIISSLTNHFIFFIASIADAGLPTPGQRNKSLESIMNLPLIYLTPALKKEYPAKFITWFAGL